MDNLTCVKYFKENEKNHESCNLSDLVFKDIDYSRITKEISFFRSDFSRSCFYNCTFNRNLFGRADFIDVYFKNTDFDLVDFGSCLIKNAVLERVMFNSNRYHGVAIQYTYFKKCVFRDEEFVTNMYHCEFYECTFINCTFKKSSLDCNTFSKCEFIKVDISECVAENLKFDNCSLRNVYLCANLWTTYLYKDTDIQSFEFKYRGKIEDIWNGNSKEFVDNLINKKLYFEYLNSIIIGEMIPIHGLTMEFKQLFPIIISQSAQNRKSTIIKILDMIFFYYNYYKIPLKDYISIYMYLSDINWEDIPFEEVLIYDSKLYKIRKKIEHFDFGLSYMRSISIDTVCIAQFHINSDDSKFALLYLEQVFDIANHDFCNDAYNKPLIKVIQEDKGSVILTIASAALLALFVSYVAKKVMHNTFSIQIENEIKKQILKRLSDNKSDMKNIKNVCTLAQEYELLDISNDSKQISHLSSELTKGEILSIILNFLF